MSHAQPVLSNRPELRKANALRPAVLSQLKVFYPQVADGVAVGVANGDVYANQVSGDAKHRAVAALLSVGRDGNHKNDAAAEDSCHTTSRLTRLLPHRSVLRKRILIRLLGTDDAHARSTLRG
jgi:hypothetical protein